MNSEVIFPPGPSLYILAVYVLYIKSRGSPVILLSVFDKGGLSGLFVSPWSQWGGGGFLEWGNLQTEGRGNLTSETRSSDIMQTSRFHPSNREFENHDQVKPGQLDQTQTWSFIRNSGFVSKLHVYELGFSWLDKEQCHEIL